MTTSTPLHLRAAAVLAGWIDSRLAIPPDTRIGSLEDLDRELCAAAHRFNAGVTSADSWACPWTYDRGERRAGHRLSLSRTAGSCYHLDAVASADALDIRIQTGTTGIIPFSFRTTVSASGIGKTAVDWRKDRPLFADLGRVLVLTPFFPEAVATLLDVAGPDALLAPVAPLGQALVCALRIGTLETLLGRNPAIREPLKPEVIDRAAALEIELADWQKRFAALVIPALTAAKALPRPG